MDQYHFEQVFVHHGDGVDGLSAPSKEVFAYELGEVGEEIGVAGAREGVNSGRVRDSGEEEVVFELFDQEVDGLVGEHVLNFPVAQQIDPKKLVSVEAIMCLGVVEPQETRILKRRFA